MPPRPGPHLDLYLVPQGGGAVPSDSDLIRVLGEPEEPSQAPELVEGGFSSWRADRPRGPVLYANRQGGFFVRCPETGQNVVPAFNPALAQWRAGGAPELSPCPSCGSEHLFRELDYAPPAAIGQGALVLIQAGSMRLTARGRDQIEGVLGPVVVVGARR